MNLLSLIIIFLALAVCGAIAYVAWAITGEAEREGRSGAPLAPREPTDPPDDAAG